MKQIILALLITGTAVISAGCSNSNAAEDETKKARSASVTEEINNKSSVIQLTREEFLSKVYNYEENSENWIYEGDKPCIVDFYADWCQPCKIAAPILEDLAQKYEGGINVYKVDTEKERALAGAFGIRSIPTFLLCPMDGLPQTLIGVGQTEEATRDMFEKAIEDVLLTK